MVHTTDANPLTVYAETNDDGRVMLKWAHYLDVYHRYLARFRGLPVTLIEIGVLRGGSLRMWRDYLGAQATIVGVDIDPECAKFREIGIEIVIGDQGDRAFLQALRARFPAPAILLDAPVFAASSLRSLRHWHGKHLPTQNVDVRSLQG